MMLQESMLIVPKHDNAGVSLDSLRDQIAARMVDSFGGVTCRDATGMWRDNTGKLYREPVTELVSAATESPETDSTLRTLANEVGRKANQLAVYVRFPNGRVEIVDTSNAVPANDNKQGFEEH